VLVCCWKARAPSTDASAGITAAAVPNEKSATTVASQIGSIAFTMVCPLLGDP
jgi:hypothetical protein